MTMLIKKYIAPFIVLILFCIRLFAIQFQFGSDFYKLNPYTQSFDIYYSTDADPLMSASTNYIQNRNTLQSGATFYTSSGTVVNLYRDGKLVATVENVNSTYTYVLEGNATAYLTVEHTTKTTLGGLNVVGSVGIGTSVPAQKVDVIVSNAAQTHALRWGNSGGTDLGLLTEDPVSYGSGAIYLQQNGSNSTRISANGSSYLMGGNVGIGTTAPSGKFHVVGSSGGIFMDLNSGNSPVYNRIKSAETAAGTGKGLVFVTNDAGDNNILYLSKNGNVGIGTADPLALFQLNKTAGGAVAIIGSSDGGANDEEFQFRSKYTPLLNTSSITASIVGAPSETGGRLILKTAQSVTGTLTERMRLTDVGDVGIGTSIPSTRLHLLTTDADNELRVTANNTGGTEYDPGIRFTGQSNDAAEGFRMWYDNSVGDTYLDNILNGGGSTTPAIRLRTNVNGSPISALTITHAGNVGIGTTAPGQRLTVFNGDLDFNYADFATSTQTIILGTPKIYRPANTNDLAFLTSNDRTNWSEKMRLTFGGNVGIGTTAPSDKLHVFGSGSTTRLKLDSDVTDQLELIWAKAGTPKWLAYMPASSNDLIFFDSDIRLVLKSGGNVGIGTTGPLEKLDVNGAILLAESGVSGGVAGAAYLDQVGMRVLHDGATLTSSPVGLGIATIRAAPNVALKNTGGPSLIVEAGNVGIGTTSPGAQLEVEDNIMANAIYNDAANSLFHIAGGNSTTDGANIELYGGSHASLANKAYYDAVLHTFRDQDADPTMLVLDSANLVSSFPTGNVGIGTTNPIALLESRSNVASSTPTVLRLSNFVSGADDLGTRLIFGSGGNAYNSQHLASIVGQHSAGGNTQLTFRTNAGANYESDTERMRIDHNGNVGIGTNAPVSGLHVLHAGSAPMRVKSTLATSAGGSLFYNNNDENMEIGMNGTSHPAAPSTAFVWTANNLPMRFGTNNTERVRILAGGNVGIGTDAPTSKLHVTGSSAFDAEDTAWTFDAGGADRLGFVKKSGNFAVLAAGSGSPIVFSHSSVADLQGTAVSGQTITNRMVIDSNGKMGIGTDSPSSLLDIVAGSITVRGAASGINTQGVLQIGSTYTFRTNGHFVSTGTAPTVGSGVGDCGTSPSIAGTDLKGSVTVGSVVNGGVCTITFAAPFAQIPTCIAQNTTTANLVRAAGATTTTVALTGTFTAGDRVNYFCFE